MPEKKLADRIREAIRLRGYSIRTEKAYVAWYERYVRFHKLRHPSSMGAAEVEQFLTSLAHEEQVSASTQNQALQALLFLYREVLGIPLGDIHALRATFAHRLKEAGCQLDDTRSEKLMGHADIRTTQHYLEGQAPAHKRLHGPLSRKP